MSKCGKLEVLTLTLLRIGVGVIMAVHGWDKLQNFSKTVEGFGSMGLPYPKILAGLAVAGELGGGLGLIVGLLTPLAALGIAITMGVAVFKVHFPNGLLAKNGGYEYPLTLLLASLYFVARGGGPISLDRLFCRKSDKTAPFFDASHDARSAS